VPRVFHKSVVVGPESIDAVGHVNNREYLRWMEEIAVEHSAARGWPMQRYFDAGTAWVASTHFIEYLRPAFEGNVLDVYTWIAEWERRTCLRRYAVMRNRKLLARGETCWTFVELASGRATDLPAAVSEAFALVEDGSDELKQLGIARRGASARSTV
jgi:acyl-CoA thioester hydrolase